MGCSPHDVSRVFPCKHKAVKSDSKKSLRVGKFIASVYDVYFPGDHGHCGTDADHVPIIPGNNFTPDDSNGDERLQRPAFGNMAMDQAQAGE